MNPEPTAPPPPSNPNWHRFSNNVIGCKSLVNSYLDAGYHCTKATAYVNASRLRRKPVVDEYIRYWCDRQHEQRMAAIMEKQRETFRIRL